MKNIIDTMNILFQVASPQKALDFYLEPKINSCEISKVTKSMELEPLFAAVLPKQYSMNEIQNISKLLSHEWCRQANTKDNKATLFNVLSHFTANLEVLEEYSGEPVVNYNKLTEWRKISHILGEDILSTAFLAYKDYLGNCGEKRCFFDWRPVLKNNNQRLRELFSRGLAENHYHLYGSAPTAEISWMALMNEPTAHRKSFKVLKKRSYRMKERINISFDYRESNLELLVRKASVIRLALYEIVHGICDNECENKIADKEHIDNRYGSILRATTLEETDIWMQDIKTKIDTFTYDNSVNFKAKNTHYDYAIKRYSTCKSADEYKGNIAFSGERELLYKFYLGLYSGKQEYHNAVNLFYAYILIYVQFRGELVQTNDRVGFDNFEKYQDNKFTFLDGTKYERLGVSMATTATIENQSINHLEARITPKKRSELYNRIKFIDAISVDANFYQDRIFDKNVNVTDKKLFEDTKTHCEKLFYNIHFIKIPDDKLEKEFWADLKPRNSKLRDKIKNDALELLAFKKSNHSLKNRILGIDAASSEIGCRPEVFAQIFRMFRDYEPCQEDKYFQTKHYTKPGITYHVGEDFLDLIDGLRAIDEAVKFLRLGQGDRMGHALALGVCPEHYYGTKGQILVMPRQDLLDNAVWMYNQMRKFNIHDVQVEKILEKVFIHSYKQIYSNVLSSSDEVHGTPCLDTYYDSWKLRGDNPEKIKEFINYNNESQWITANILQEQALTIWDNYAYGLKDSMDQRIYNDRAALKLYQHYHFNRDVKVKGAEITEFKITPGYVKVVEQIQKCIQLVIQQKNIGIETNPSSNVLIGTFKSYETHPIYKWYNMGLTYSEEELRKCPQMYISVNTDDQGVFNTYLENEYALLAQTLERQKDEHNQPLYRESMIYEWLDNIRRMGIQQSFATRK